MAAECEALGEPSDGLARPFPVELANPNLEVFSFSASDLTDCLIAGEAGMVLSRFLESVTPAARKEDVFVFIVGRELALRGLAVFVGEPVLVLAMDLLSEVVVC
jgi:hypothetical protein